MTCFYCNLWAFSCVSISFSDEFAVLFLMTIVFLIHNKVYKYAIYVSSGEEGRLVIAVQKYSQNGHE